VYESLVIKK